jgi:hypothetical protein
MTKHFHLIVLAFFAFSALADPVPDIAIACKNSDKTETIKLNINLLQQFARLSYEKAVQTSVNLTIRHAKSINESGNVWISTSTVYSNKTITFGGQTSKPVRVTNFANFSLTLVENADGTYRADELTYGQGIEEFYDRNDHTFVSLKDMSCTIEGLNVTATPNE